MASKKETAEQKLLKLIESSHGQKSAPAEAAPVTASTAEQPIAANTPASESEQIALKVAQSVRGSSGPGFKMPSFISQMENLFKKGGGQGLGLRQVNGLLTLATVGMIFLFSGKMYLGWSESNQKISYQLDTRVAQTGAQPLPLPTAKDVQYYLDLVQTRNVFKPYEKKDGQDKKADSDNRVIATKVQHLKLRGISWLDSPETASVMIEDTDTGTTHFLKQGDQVKDIKVKTIYADQVIMSYGGEEVAIKL